MIIRYLFITFLLVYQIGLSPLLPRSCRFIPTCSEYALVALLRYGLQKGGSITLRRLVRCHPWGDFGFDPV